MNRYQVALHELGQHAAANGEVVPWVNALLEAVGKIRAGEAAMEVRAPGTIRDDANAGALEMIGEVWPRQIAEGDGG